jgi:hypothetical protein
MPTKLSQDQVENLNSDLDSLDLKDASLESKISTEDSINDDVDISLQGQIDVLKNTVLSLVFGNRTDLIVDENNLMVFSPTEFPIPVFNIEYNWYFNDNLISTTGTSVYSVTESGVYYVIVTYSTNLGIHSVSSDPIIYEPSK